MDVSQYLEIFIDETSEHLQNLSDCIMELEKDPENMDTINEIFRACATFLACISESVLMQYVFHKPHGSHRFRE